VISSKVVTVVQLRAVASPICVPKNFKSPVNYGPFEVLKYRYRDSKTGFRRERRTNGPPLVLQCHNVILFAGETR